MSAISKVIDLIQWNITSRTKRSELLRKKGVKIGKGCEIYRDVNFGSEPYLIKIGNNVRIASGVKFCTHDGGMWTLRKMDLLENADIFGPIEIGDNVHIGWNAIIMPGVTIGDNCIVGCGAIVTKSIAANSVAVGVPAVPIKDINSYYDKSVKNCVLTAGLTSDEKKRVLLEKYN